MSRLALPAALVLLAAPLVAQDTQADRWEAAVQTFDTFTVLDSTVGGALVMVRDGEILREHYMGIASPPFALRNSVQLANRNTIWHWGSITKTLTAVAVMQEFHRFYCPGEPCSGLETRVTSLVPEVARIHNPWGGMEEITLRMLLSHSSGLPNGTWPWTRGEPWEPFEPTEWSQLVAMMPYMKLGFEPGTRYGYSNPAFVYLARAVEAVTGDPWQGYVHKSLFMPLGMEASYFGRTPRHLIYERSSNFRVDSTGIVDRGPDFDPGITIPNGGWNAPVTDVARWIGFLSGSSDRAAQARYDRLMPRNLLESMWEPVVRVSDTEQMGLSFFLREVDGQRLVGHTGTQANFRSFFWLNPETRTAVIGVVNTSGAGGAQAGPRFEAMMGEAMKSLVVSR